MISRRSFLTALSCLPFVGKFVQKDQGKWFVAYDTKVTTITLPPPPQGLVFHRDAFKFVMRPLRGETRPRLTFAEWDQRYQA